MVTGVGGGVIRDMMANELADQIEAELRKIKPKYAIIFREMYNGNLQAINIAKNNKRRYIIV